MVTNIKNLDEKELIAQAKAGSQKAFEEIFRRYKNSIKIFAQKKLNGVVDSEDFVQDVFLKAFKALPNYESEYRFSTWLMRISTNTAIDEYRINSRVIKTVGMTFESDDEESTVEFKDSRKNPLEEVMKDDRREIIMKVIKEKLSHCDFDKLVYARFFEDKALDVIAKEMGLPLGTVKAKIHRAEKILFEHLKANKDLLLNA